MSYNEIIEYYIPKHVRNLLTTDDRSSQLLALALSKHPLFVLYWADIIDYKCEAMGIPDVPYTDCFYDHFDCDNGMAVLFSQSVDIDYGLGGDAEHPELFIKLVIKLIEKGLLTYNEEILNFLKQKLATSPTC